MKTDQVKTGIFLAILAAALYAVNSPLSKILLDYMPSTLMAGFLYLGAGIGMGVIALIRKLGRQQIKESGLTKKELPYTIAMILLDIAAPICLLFGLRSTTAANASLLNNFEIVATAVIALAVFREKISFRLWLGILFIVLSCALLSFEDISSLQFSYGSLFILIACVCWGFENNCTRKISSKDPLAIVLLKGIFSGLGSVIIGLATGERITRSVERFRRARRRVCCVRTKHIFLCVRSAHARRGAHKCVLCRCAIYRHDTFAYHFQRNSALYIFYSLSSDESGRVAGIAG